MFDKVLVANRGVIACRIIRTLHTMGIGAVAVYSDADRFARHVEMADEAFRIGEGPASASYLRSETILEVACSCGAGAIHPGYGFLSENPDFAASCEEAGIAFIGPTASQMRLFGPKHSARELARRENVPLLPGSGLLEDADDAAREANRIGYPVMLKSTGGGGGIGMRLIETPDELGSAFESVSRLAQSNFKDGGLYLERFVRRARHIEVQIFGDGRGNVVALGERDCSVQRRNQKVIEETPAPNLSQARRSELQSSAVALARAGSYRSAGTVEFVFDEDRDEFYFLEVNTRLQVEHGVTEEVMGIDLVEWMVRLAAGEMPSLMAPTPRGHSMQVRVYAEDPSLDFRPCAGLLTQADFPQNARVETWVEAGTEVPPFYDPMLAKIIVCADNREAALEKLQSALDETHLAGIETNVSYLRQIVRDDTFREGRQTTSYLSTLPVISRGVEIIEAGIQTLVQDFPGRLGYWDVGVPPSGPMDSLALRLANRLVGNKQGAAGLECTVSGPTMRFRHATTIALGGADMGASVNGEPLAPYEKRDVAAGAVLKMGRIEGAGVRAYVAIQGGVDVPDYLGSKSTFTLGNFGGHAGRTLRPGDVLPIGEEIGRFTASVAQSEVPVAALQSSPAQATPPFRQLESPNTQSEVPVTQSEPSPTQREVRFIQPHLSNNWEIGVLYGPHAAPDFFTPADIEEFFAASWEVHYNSSRTGVRLIGPKPTWARADGGEAGLHPSNIHDNAYAIGAVDFTGDTPIILGPDGPSLGGFVCPVCIIEAELWKVGQLRPGDKLRFVPVSFEDARARLEALDEAVETLDLAALATPLVPVAPGGAVLVRREESDSSPSLTIRQDGDAYLLVEYGPVVLDIALRMRVHALMLWIQSRGLRGLIDLTPGIRSLHLHFDPHLVRREDLLLLLEEAETQLGGGDVEIDTRVVHLPLSWDDPVVGEAIERYSASVRPNAPWAPSNIEFIRRINGLESTDRVREIVFEASYLVLGLGDVYLGAPVATPVDPRHRLVTTKYNPARTWTAKNTVGIGGAYMCIYGLEGPGGYQLVGRTLPIWNTFRATPDFEKGKPYLLRFFDQVRYYPVSPAELEAMRDDFTAGRFALQIEHETFKLSDYNRFLEENADTIRAAKARQQAAFEAEREAWIRDGQADYSLADSDMGAGDSNALEIPEGATALVAPTSGMVWKTLASAGERAREGDVLLVLESMKTEFTVVAPFDGEVIQFACVANQAVTAGQTLVVFGRKTEE